MPDYKFRITVDLELTTLEPPANVREFLKMETEDWLAAKAEELSQLAAMRLSHDPPLGGITHIPTFQVRAKRLDDTALIGPPISLLVPTLTCPWCQASWKDVLIERVPVTCRRCHRTIPLEGTVRPPCE
jgi:hypothetical protein